ncbi:MAG: hypothetical protein NUK65_03060 [Firmicutes bacterium]|nr:hypothetical protein [Bacillota bacterium]
MKKHYCILFLMIILVLLIGCNPLDNRPNALKSTIEAFFDVQYDAYITMEYKNMTTFLDMSQIQNQNKVIALKHLTTRRKYAAEKQYGYVEKNRFPITFQYHEIQFNENQAQVTLELELDQTAAYPPFISSGEQVFTLELIDGFWRITNHIYDSLHEFELSTKDRITEFTTEQINSQVDLDYG